ncbi:hypothetical protein H9660_14230 [Clostridium sp. Sa3CUN1]|uniref:Uncharacterized protein n=1 Tax=Clostridium gallinarum TaxID=2762246 RepID=A0ABR8Q796_9CLOT|nr:hypothetical protein [Clostridium gallinarum]MBD7916301.1 hypothetical protein [Clostridium gallinarum]
MARNKPDKNSSKLDMDSKELAMLILKERGIDYEDFLNEKHREVIQKNALFIKEAIEFKREMEKQ